MTLAQIYKNEYALIETNNEDKLIQLTWLQHVDGAPLREVLFVALEHARAEGLNCWLFDMRKINYVTIADQTWTVKEFFPSFDFKFHHRLACLASTENIDMLPDALINELCRSNTTVAERIELRMFLNKEFAMYWLFA